MAKVAFLFAFLFVGGLALPTTKDDGPGFDDDLSMFFDHDIEDIQGRIIGGTTAREGAFPWMVALTNGAARNFICGGSVVTARSVLTAAHCVRALVIQGQLSATLRVTVGTNRWNSGGTIHALSGHRIHPNYNPNILKNDVAVLLSRSNLITSARVRVIPLSYDFVGGNIACRVSGWGRTRTGGPISATLQEITKRTTTGQHCVTEIARVARSLNIHALPVDPAVEICTFVGVNRGTCHGDSGSALVRNSNTHQIGVVSWGLPCARGAPDVFARISAFRGWLPNAIR